MTEINLTLFLRGSMISTYDHNSANTFAGTFAFLPTLNPSQKRQKSLQATTQGQCKLDTADLRPKSATSANSSLAKWRVTCFYDSLVLNQSVVLRLNFCAYNPPLCQAANRQTPVEQHKLFTGHVSKNPWILWISSVGDI